MVTTVEAVSRRWPGRRMDPARSDLHNRSPWPPWLKRAAAKKYGRTLRHPGVAYWRDHPLANRSIAFISNTSKFEEMESPLKCSGYRN